MCMSIQDCMTTSDLYVLISFFFFPTITAVIEYNSLYFASVLVIPQKYRINTD